MLYGWKRINRLERHVIQKRWLYYWFWSVRLDIEINYIWKSTNWRFFDSCYRFNCRKTWVPRGQSQRRFINSLIVNDRDSSLTLRIWKYRKSQAHKSRHWWRRRDVLRWSEFWQWARRSGHQFLVDGWYINRTEPRMVSRNRQLYQYWMERHIHSRWALYW